jgi:O-antigen ligase
VVWLIRRFLFDSLPCWPGSNVAILDAKGGDVFVHLGGTLAFWVAGLEDRVSGLRVSLMAFCVALVGTFDRAGLLSYMAVFAACLVHQPLDRSLWRLMVAGSCGIVLLAVANVHIEMPGREREISFEQIANNVSSIVSRSEAGDLDGTKRWRLEWWGVIADYTVFGEYFWTGKGFGINLADDDGFQCNEDGSVRSPHNVHMTFLARMGVPGVLLWVVLQGVWAAGILRGYLRSRLVADRRWSGVFLFLGAYWMAFLINASFDVFLEGPMGGIWFWTLFGAGLAAMRIHRLRPEVLTPCDESPFPPAPRLG